MSCLRLRRSRARSDDGKSRRGAGRVLVRRVFFHGHAPPWGCALPPPLCPPTSTAATAPPRVCPRGARRLRPPARWPR
eukprot:32104-Prorocentrum_minimum.AAC.2